MSNCVGCDHPLRSHFRSLSDEVVCLVTTSGVSSSGVMGIPWTSRCDCVDFQSPKTQEMRAEKAREEARMEEVKEHWRKVIAYKPEKKES